MAVQTETGWIARVLQGRGKGELVYVLGESPDGRLLVANGRAISTEKPKKKNRKHLEAVCVSQEIQAAGERPSNRYVREQIRTAEKGIIEQEGLFCQRMM